MAHFAKIENNTVVQTIVIANSDCNNLEFPESEPIGQQFIKSIGLNGHWLQTSYNRNFRGHFASAGYLYNKDLDSFVPPKPFDSWFLDTENLRWNPPVPYPETVEDTYYWNEETQSWDLHIPPEQESDSNQPIWNDTLPGEPDYELD